MDLLFLSRIVSDSLESLINERISAENCDVVFSHAERCGHAELRLDDNHEHAVLIFYVGK